MTSTCITNECITEPARDIPVLKDVDILVIGGSQAGVAAALSAKRANPDASVLIVEQEGFLGGQAVGCMVVHWEFREFTNNQGQVIARGIGKEMIRRIVEKGHSDPLFKDWLDGKGPPFEGVPDGRASNDVPLEVEDIKLVLAEMCEEVGVDVLLHARACNVLPPDLSTGFPAPRGVFVETINGRYAIKARIIIDCTANADVSFWLNEARVPATQVMSMQAYAWIGNVDLEKFVEDGVFGAGQSGSASYPHDKQQMLDHVHQGKTILARGFTPAIDKTYENEPETIEAYDTSGATPQINFYVKTVRTFPVEIDGKTRYLGTFAIEGPSFKWSQVDPILVSKAEIAQLKAVAAQVRMHRYIPGWENAVLDRTVSKIGFRQTRIPNGVYELTRADITEHRQFEDVIGRHTGHDVGRNVKGGEFGYDIPYRCLVPARIDGLLFGARAVSTESDDADEHLTALNSHRGISSTMIVGQASGVAAALCIKNGVEPRDLDVRDLQGELARQDVILEAPQ
ncbi:MAG TPA: FAD-dependent oxidoreductase [Candidatus Lokiarchaeia archaeon]|nr:FAD-dependent oxidoreductase [Candidatus Lokiarchaeia archaeon]